MKLDLRTLVVVDAGLLGKRHSELVRNLLSHLSGLVAGDVSLPRAVVLEGASGVGKSRIVRQVYRALRDLQPVPGYWPALPETDQADSQPIAIAGYDLLRPEEQVALPSEADLNRALGKP